MMFLSEENLLFRISTNLHRVRGKFQIDPEVLRKHRDKSRNRLHVGADTGPTHLAVALETRTIMLMGATNPRRTGSYDQQENIMLVDRPCKICMKKFCPKQADCLEKLTPEMVQRKIMEMR